MVADRTAEMARHGTPGWTMSRRTAAKRQAESARVGVHGVEMT
jgi:hypothetical protein